MSSEERKPKGFTDPMPKKMFTSSTPIKFHFDPVSKNSYNTNNGCTMNYQRIYPGIYMTSAKDLCSADDLKMFGFTHIIYIDKHVIVKNSEIVNRLRNKLNGQKSYCDSSFSNDPKASITTIKQGAQFSTNMPHSPAMNTHDSNTRHNSSINCHEMPIDVDLLLIGKMDNENIFGHSDFETLDLNFGETSYLTTVLPNCYKAVKFIEKALKNNGAVLVIDCIGESQKCITIVIGFLMYKYNKNFLTAYQLIKRLHPDFELDKFFTTQLYEYEPILEVQRSQLAGNSCSRELRSTLYKRKLCASFTYDDCVYHKTDTTMPSLLPHNSLICNGVEHYVNNIEQTMDIHME